MAGLLKKYLGPPNALILLRDHIDDESLPELESQLDAIREHYEFVKLEAIAARLVAGKVPRGLANLSFRNPRKSLFLRVVPMLLEREIPFTVFVRSDCMGTSKLPLADEIEAYRRNFPERIPATEADGLSSRVWSEAASVRGTLVDWHRSIGPRPVARLDPTQFFSTWGKLVEVSPELLEVGVNFSECPPTQESFAAEVNLVRRISGRRVAVVYSPREMSPAWLTSSEIRARVGELVGAVERSTDPFSLPFWIMEKTSEAK